MKSIFNKLIVLVVALWSVACSNDETKIYFLGSTATPVLTVSDTATLVLTKANENYSSLQFQWTSPDYKFSNGPSTQDVYYTLQVDTTGSGFTNPKISELAYTNSLTHSFLVKDLNNALGVLELKDYKPHHFEFRIKASLANGNGVSYSNVVKIRITTYLDVVFPVPSNLYITGDATPGNWMSGGDPELTSQKFTQINSYTFQLNSLSIVAGNGFLFVPVYGNWTNKYGFTGAAHTNNTTGDSFTPNGNDFGPPAPGNYKIVVNFKTGKYSMTKL